MSQLSHPHHRAMALAGSLIGEFDAFFAWSRFSNTDLTSRALFEAGVTRLYFRFGRDKLDACIGDLVLATDPVSMFKNKLEPLLKHAQNFRGSIFVEVMELSPELDAQLGPYLTGTGWVDSSLCPETRTYGERKGEAYCRPGFSFVDAPTQSRRMQFEHWRRIQLERSSLKSLFRDAHPEIRAAIRSER